MDELIMMRRRANQAPQRQGGGRSLPTPGSMGSAKNARTTFSPPQKSPVLRPLPPMALQHGVRLNPEGLRNGSDLPVMRPLSPASLSQVPQRLLNQQPVPARGPVPQRKPVLNNQNRAGGPGPLQTADQRTPVLRDLPPWVVARERARQAQNRAYPSSPPAQRPVLPASNSRGQATKSSGPQYTYYEDEYTRQASAQSPQTRAPQTRAPQSRPPQSRPPQRAPAHRPQLGQTGRQPIPQSRPQLREVPRQNPNQLRQAMAQPVQAPTPPPSAEWQQAWAVYQQNIQLYDQMLSSSVAGLVHKMAMDRGSFPTPEALYRYVPLPPPMIGQQPEQDVVQQAKEASRNYAGAHYLNNVMDQVVEGSGLGSLRSVYGELSQNVLGMIKQLTTLAEAGEQMKDHSSVLVMAQHVNRLCDAGLGMKAYLGGMYLSDVVFGILDRVKAFSGRVATMLQARERADRMRVQRGMAKEDVRDSLEHRIADARQTGGPVRGASQYLMEESSTGGFFRQKETKLRMKRQFGSDGYGRATRMDEQLLRMRDIQKRDLANGQLQGDNAKRVEEELTRAEDYDLARELVEANQKRASGGFWDIMIKDASAVVTGLLSLDPVGGRALGGVLNALIEGGEAVKNKLSETGQKYRNLIGFGTDRNKTDQMKAQRRHNLAHIMYRQLYTLTKEDALSMPRPTPSGDPRQWMEMPGRVSRYYAMGERLDATGQSGRIYAAANANEMLTEIRKSFYQSAP